MKAIVLSGGGAKGAYQIGALKALEKLGIDFDIAVGTSIGSLNAAFIVQNELEKGYDLWKNMDYNYVFTDELDSPSNLALAKLYAKNFKEYGGFNVSSFEENVRTHVDYEKFKNSEMNFGLVTYNLTDLKPEYILKKDLTESSYAEYLIASSSCFPFFPKKVINGKEYIDGGYHDNLPINLAVEMGATNIIAIDLSAVGIKKKPKKNLNLKIIKPRSKLNSILHLSNDSANRLLKLGYNDVLKEYSKYEGNIYTFYNGEVSNFIYKKQRKLEHNLNKIYKNISVDCWNLFDDICDCFDIEDFNVYKLKDINNIILSKITKIKFESVFDLKKEHLRIEVIKYLLDLIKQNKYKELKKVRIIFKREIVIAMYIYLFVKKNYFFNINI